MSRSFTPFWSKELIWTASVCVAFFYTPTRERGIVLRNSEDQSTWKLCERSLPTSTFSSHQTLKPVKGIFLAKKVNYYVFLEIFIVFLLNPGDPRSALCPWGFTSICTRKTQWSSVMLALLDRINTAPLILWTLDGTQCNTSFKYMLHFLF